MTNGYDTTGPQKQPIFGSHDDPVVVDNGPARVDFGDGQHAPRDENGVIKRAYTRFARMVTAVVKNGKVVGRVEVHELAPDKPITFELEDGNRRGALTFAIEARQQESDLAVSPSGDFTFELRDREMKHGNHDPRVIKISQNNVTLRSAEDDPKNRVILAVLLAAPETRQADAAPPAPASRSGERGASALRVTGMLALVAVLGLLAFRLVEGIRGSHDDPIVVDNGPITVIKGNADPVQKDTPARWTIHHSARLKLLYAFTQHEGQAWRSLEQPISLSGVKDITFDLLDVPGQPPSAARQMTIFRDRWWEALVQKAHLHADVDFRKQGKALTPENQAYRIGQVWVDGQPVCLVDSEKPETSRCANWRAKPARVKILICAEAAKCESYFPATR
jgi:hypothetical protein